MPSVTSLYSLALQATPDGDYEAILNQAYGIHFHFPSPHLPFLSLALDPDSPSLTFPFIRSQFSLFLSTPAFMVSTKPLITSLDLVDDGFCYVFSGGDTLFNLFKLPSIPLQFSWNDL